MKNKMIMLALFVSSMLFSQEKCFEYSKIKSADSSKFEKNVFCLNPDAKMLRVNKDVFKVKDAVENKDGTVSILTIRKDEYFIFTVMKDDSVLVERENSKEYVILW